MDQIFERLETLLKSMFQDQERSSSRGSNFSDPDLKDAWEELDDFLRGETGGERDSHRQQERTSYYKSDPKEELRKDFQVLEVPFGSSLETVKKSYKVLLRKYHPDLHASDPEKLKNATEVTQKLNQAYQRIESYYEKLKNL